MRVIAKRCAAVGNRGLLNATRATMRAEALPLISAAQRAALERLPKRGGLNVQVASQKWTLQALAGARTAGVRLKTAAPDTLQTDEGYVRHPIFGHRGKGQWRTQQTPNATGWASDTVDAYGPALSAALMVTLDKVAAGIVAGI